jgi:hypothetical protein
MIKQSIEMLRYAPIVIIAALAAACGGGGEAEFVKACMNESGSPSSDMFQQQMGVSKEAFCKCGAKTARSSLSGKAFHAMVLDMQGKKQEAFEITSKMGADEQQKLMMGMAQVFQNCANVGHQ